MYQGENLCSKDIAVAELFSVVLVLILLRRKESKKEKWTLKVSDIDLNFNPFYVYFTQVLCRNCKYDDEDFESEPCSSCKVTNFKKKEE